MIYAKKVKENFPKKTSFFVFFPNCNKLDLEKCKEKSSKMGASYNLITYKKLHDLFVKYPSEKTDRSYDDFIRALVKHKSEIAGDLFEETRRRFGEAIRKLKKVSNNVMRTVRSVALMLRKRHATMENITTTCNLSHILSSFI